MRTSPQLSSSWTFLHKWILPAFPLLALALSVLGALRGPSGEWISVIFWSAVSVGLLIWAWPMKHVTIEGDYFRISNYFVSHRMPFAHLASIAEIRDNRTPAINLYFDPPTPFGRRVRIIPPTGIFVFDREGFNEVVTFLRGLLNDPERPGAKMRAS
jgi:hypothetical protein